jgi:DNA repair protein RadC
MTDNDNAGHRQRLKLRATSSPESLQNYELIELLLCYANPRKDMKKIAKSIINEYNSLNSFLNADLEQLLKINGVGESATALISLINEINKRQNFEKISDAPILSSWNNLIQYLKISVGSASVEELKIIYVDKKFMILKEETHSSGTIDQISAYPREIIKKAILYNATAVFLAHNHPSNIAKPSKADIDFTNKLSEALKTINVKIIDHVIVTNSSHYSFAANGLL